MAAIVDRTAMAGKAPEWPAAFRTEERSSGTLKSLAETLHAPIVRAIAAAARAQGGPLVVGLSGSQGSGKSTMAASLVRMLESDGLRAATLSIDDLYLTRAERTNLAAHVHPLLATRGPPGTHDVTLGIATIDAVVRGEAVRLPRFAKAIDDRLPEADWETIGPVDVLIFEGWCVGARAQAEAALVDPVNALERDEDEDGCWRRFVNRALAHDYPPLFARIDALILLIAPGWPAVVRWRQEQENELRAHVGAGHKVMTPGEVARFVQFYERLTGSILMEMPTRADLAVSLDAARRPIAVRNRARGMFATAPLRPRARS